MTIAIAAPTNTPTTKPQMVCWMLSQAPTPANSLTSPAPMPPMAYIGSRQAIATPVPSRLHKSPYQPNAIVAKIQPLTMNGYVSQLGTLSSMASITEPTIRTTVTSHATQCSDRTWAKSVRNIGILVSLPRELKCLGQGDRRDCGTAQWNGSAARPSWSSAPSQHVTHQRDEDRKAVAEKLPASGQ